MTQAAIYADLLACAVSTGDFHPDGTPRSTDNDFCAQPRVLTQAEQDHAAYKADQLRRYHLRSAAKPRAYAARFATVEALENHRASARAYADKKRLEAAATRVNKDAGLGFFQQPNKRGMAGAAFRSMP